MNRLTVIRNCALLALAAAAAASAAAAPAADATERTGDLYVATTQSGSLTPGKGGGYRLTLKRPGSTLTSFTDRPTRSASAIDVQNFVRDWKLNGFRADPPNAALSIDGAPRAHDVMVMTLSQPRLARNGALSFRVKPVKPAAGSPLHDWAARADASLPRSFKRASLFIDDGADTIQTVTITATLPAGAGAGFTFDDDLTVTPNPNGRNAEVDTLTTGPARTLVEGNGVVMTGAGTPVTITQTVAVQDADGAITGNASLFSGATATAAVNGGTPQPLPAGDFSLAVD